MKETFSRLFEREVAVFFVATGTAANALALSAFARPAGLILCHADAHMNTDEGGAVEFLAGLKLIGVHGAAGKIQPDALADAIARFPPNAARYGQLAAISLSELAEFGTAYNIAEITALSEIAKDAGLAVHMDGGTVRKRSGRPRIGACRTHLEGGRRRSFIRWHQGRLLAGRGGGVLRSGEGS